MTPEASAIITVGAFLLSVATFYVGRQSASKAEGKEAGGLAKDIEYIRDSVERIETRLNDDVKRLEGRIDEVSKQVNEATGTAARAHESGKSAHKRIDEHLERDHDQILVKHKGGNRDE